MRTRLSRPLLFGCMVATVSVLMEGAAAAQSDGSYVPIDLGTLGGTYSTSNAVTDNGEVFGVSSIPNGDYHEFLWTATDGMVDLGPSGQRCEADALNESLGFQMVVGHAPSRVSTGGTPPHARAYGPRRPEWLIPYAGRHEQSTLSLKRPGPGRRPQPDGRRRNMASVRMDTVRRNGGPRPVISVRHFLRRRAHGHQ